MEPGAFLHDHAPGSMRLPPRRRRVLESKDRPSRKLLEHTAAMIKAQSDFVLLDEQRVAFESVLAEAHAGYPDAKKTVADALVMRRALSYARAFDLLVLQHPEDPSLAADGVMNEGETSTRLGLQGVPAEAETIMVARDLELARLTGTDDPADGVARLAADVPGLTIAVKLEVSADRHSADSGRRSSTNRPTSSAVRC